ncbi:MAG: helix-turn-helix domain-containing protein [Thermoleophilaceae bacterium]
MKSFVAINEPRVAKALSHPLRAQILGILEERRASPRELSEELGAPLGNVSYHVRALLNLKLIKLVKKTPRRGAIEHHYEATGSAARVPEVEWEKMPSIAKQAVVGAVLDETNRSVAEAAAVGGFDRRDAHITRTKLVLDEKGFKELSEALGKLLERAEKIQEQSGKRLASSNHEGEHQAALALMLFETQPAAGETADANGRTTRRSAGARA